MDKFDTAFLTAMAGTDAAVQEFAKEAFLDGKQTLTILKSNLQSTVTGIRTQMIQESSLGRFFFLKKDSGSTEEAKPFQSKTKVIITSNTTK